MVFRVLIVAAALVLALGAAGCGNDVEEEGSDTTATEATTGGGETEGETEEETATGEEGGAGTGDAANGAEVFASAGCGGCHTLAAANSSGNTGPNLDDAQPDFEAAVAQVTNGGGGMPPFQGQLSDQEIRDVAAYVSENAGS
jgi:mono/diheme cytochrome c family protein